MATLGRARRASRRRVAPSANGSTRLPTIRRVLLAVSATSIVLAIAGCSTHSNPEKSASIQDESIQDKSAASRTAPAYSQSETHRSYRALVAPQSAPNCELTGPEADTVDGDLWARLKLDYERHCYKQAEMLARKRLRQLLASGRCRIEPE